MLKHRGSLCLDWLVHRLMSSSSTFSSTSRSISSGKQLGVLATQHNDAFLTNVPLLFLGLNQETKSFRATSLLTWEQIVSDPAFRRWFRPLPASYEACMDSDHRQSIRCRAARRFARRFVNKHRYRARQMQPCNSTHENQDINRDDNGPDRSRFGNYEKHEDTRQISYDTMSREQRTCSGLSHTSRLLSDGRPQPRANADCQSALATTNQQPSQYKNEDAAMQASSVHPTQEWQDRLEADPKDLHEQTLSISGVVLWTQEAATKQQTDILSLEADTDYDDFDDDYWSVNLEGDNSLYALRELLTQQEQSHNWYQFRTPAARGSLVFGYWGVCPYG